jgi:hypothetical protein
MQREMTANEKLAEAAANRKNPDYLYRRGVIDAEDHAFLTAKPCPETKTEWERESAIGWKVAEWWVLEQERLRAERSAEIDAACRAFGVRTESRTWHSGNPHQPQYRRSITFAGDVPAGARQRSINEWLGQQHTVCARQAQPARSLWQDIRAVGTAVGRALRSALG